MTSRDFLNPVPDLDGKSILITGGTGSFGKSFVKTVLARYKPRRIVVFFARRAQTIRDESRDQRPGISVSSLLHRRCA
ncbi:polysaccharide biosynthesis protein [Aurantimonas sp. C2-6-R+9]|uniref:polysaccharide biosynthesis protein n=1 Tax=unclassified Aurantimonas TaxID=2638230 RepID=UPI002E17FB34|nr:MULTISPECIES: polysaccharide biosynthesis protein [unclassified Aurantimonas]MEC5290528.1 polysaccharide biosynthesis protein [Aurantimonas sp. C2-3-R2]MEC5380463.1 polysaccharide biosynthesis protein [Aurantimonas sp. C2-6-R+9]MEC5411509.1 polysaccharide biosynthesis protein [Aurantimonas sp. C2-4-R8]